jgi:hypothetical protein
MGLWEMEALHLIMKHDEIPIISAKPVKKSRKSRAQPNPTLSEAKE